jgi:hypothetical protein
MSEKTVGRVTRPAETVDEVIDPTGCEKKK